ncbi:squalene/phytoene synthase family protein [Streptomyces olivochromogenes]|uniref:squalene/phytoene synthase family protein n=1 Tax=Streptomyces olivochromogenes TaxID=1963 RepID=UPI001F335380|nr:squalene/phytoene synthase family protein [Streptomyces olivochromogenes]MCF3132098.1 squalene/phytoene synthase family protein [Streptomyces olivochromogenes]
MIRWSAALTRAGITDPRLRETYDAQRRPVRRFALHEYVAVRLLLPARLHPPVIAAVAYMHATDELIDAGDVTARQAALRAWDAETTKALASSGPPAQDALLALWDTTRRHPHMGARVRAFLDGAPVEAAWTGFDTEDDFQAYVDSYSLPGLMLTASLLAPDPTAGADEPFVRGCRALIEGWQRCDFLADLPEDAASGRIGIPADELARYGLKFDDLRARSEACAPALEKLVRAQADLAEAALAGCRTLPSLVAAEHQPFLDALIAVQELQLHAVRHAGGSLLRHGTGPSGPASLRVLARQYRRARIQQRRAQ